MLEMFHGVLMNNSSVENKILISLGFLETDPMVDIPWIETLDTYSTVTFLGWTWVTLPSFHVLSSLEYPESLNTNMTMSSNFGGFL